MTRRSAAARDPDADIALLSANRLLATRRLAPGDVIDRALVMVNLSESPLAWLVRRSKVTTRQFEARETAR